MKKYIYSITVAGFLFSGFSVQAEYMDLNHDGHCSFDEIKAYEARKEIEAKGLTCYDLDGDGQCTAQELERLEEIKKLKEENSSVEFLDKNNDGYCTFEEVVPIK